MSEHDIICCAKMEYVLGQDKFDGSWEMGTCPIEWASSERDGYY